MTYVKWIQKTRKQARRSRRTFNGSYSAPLICLLSWKDHYDDGTTITQTGLIGKPNLIYLPQMVHNSYWH